MGLGQTTKRVTDIVREMFPRLRYPMSEKERELSIHLRGNAPLLESLKAVIKDRITGREHLPIPSDPMLCMASMVRDQELRWVLSRLDYIFHSPIAGQDAGEQPE